MSLRLPIAERTFTRELLDGAGTLNISAAGGGFNPAEPFPTDLKQVLNITASPDGSLTFGDAGALSYSVDFSAQASNSVRLLWPDQSTEPGLERYASALRNGQIGLLLSLSGTASGALEGTYPAGPAGITFGIKAGAGVGYDRFAVFDAARPSAQCLTDLVGGIRLPEACGTRDAIPPEGEVLAFRYDGFLELSAALNWGYQITGFKGVEFHDLDSVVEYALRLKAGVTAGYRIGGSFSVEVQRGSHPGWVRLIVRKDRESQFDFAAAFQAEGSLKLNGLPDTADEFLHAFFGSDVRAVLHALDGLRTVANPAEISKITGKLLAGTVQALAVRWLESALTDENIGQFRGIAHDTVREYEDTRDRMGESVDSVLDLYEDFLKRDEVQWLRQALEVIVRLNSRNALRQLSPDSPAWDILERLGGGDLFRVLQDNAAFAHTIDVAELALDFVNGTQLARVRDVVDQVAKDLPLDRLFGQIHKIATSEGIRNVASERLQGVIEKLLGRLWPEIQDNAGSSASELQKTLDKIDNFKNTWYARLQEAADQSFAASVNYAFSRASREESLIDIEIDLETQQGRDLFARAVRGRMQDVLGGAVRPYVVVHKGVLSHQLTKTSHLSVAVFGWSFKRLVELVSKTEYSLATTATGLVEVFTTDVSIRQREERTGRDKMAEVLESNFLMRLTGEVFRPDEEQTDESRLRKRALARVLTRMGVSYTFFASDDLTTPDELTDYLSLGEALGLLPSARAVAADLALQFPNGLGKVTAQYAVTYDEQAIHDAFTNQTGEPLRRMVRETSRQLVSTALTTSQDRARAVLAFAYLDHRNAKLYYESGWTALRDDNNPVLLPEWWTRSGAPETATMPARSPARHALVTLFNIEASLSDALVRLDNVVDKAREQRELVPVNTLEKAARQFVEKAASIDDYIDINTFFAVFDRFIHEGGNGKPRRESSLLLQVQPPGASTPIRKYFTAPPADTISRGRVISAAGTV